MNEGLQHLNSYVVWLENLNRLDESVLTEPIAEGKWSVLDILCHIWLWDLYMLEQMIPHMASGAKVRFVAHDGINSQVRRYTDKRNAADLLAEFMDVRKRMFGKFESIDDMETLFYVGKRQYSYNSFIQTYIVEHDHHHRKQIDEYIGKALKDQVTTGLRISNDKSLLDMDTVMGFLSRSYWANKRSKERIMKSIENSICYGAYIETRQIAFARIVTDGATMYWLCDVYVDEHYRGMNIGKKLIETIVQSDELKDLMGLLGTQDAHGLYEQYSFELDQAKMMRRMPDFIRNKANKQA